MKLVRPSIELATKDCQAILDTKVLQGLARNCPGLLHFDFANYLECSKVRIEKTMDALDNIFSIWKKMENRSEMRILDFGSWLSNFSLALHYEGYGVTAAEMWSRYAPALDAQKRLLADHHVDVIDMSMITGRPQGPRYNVVLFMAVIEHLQNSPRQILRTLYDCLLPGGLLILDTPNLACLANRKRLQVGDSIFPPIEEQFYTEAPFEGHVREYTFRELHWMLFSSGFEIIHWEGFDYSNISFWQSPIGEIKKSWDWTQRELIFMTARKPYEK